MKFLLEDGTVKDGTPITDSQIAAIDRLTDYLHENVCESRYHGKYSVHPCKDAANAIIPKLDGSALVAFCAALPVLATPEPAPAPELQAPQVGVEEDDLPL